MPRRSKLLFAALLAACATRSPAGEEMAIRRVLDDFHDAASKADEERYFALFAPDGVFLGTDATERWTVEEFRRYAHPHFSKGRGWTYAPRDRHVWIARDGRFATFDELLDNEGYGELRGTGALARTDEGWRILQYNLTFTVPNDAADDVVKRIRAGN